MTVHTQTLVLRVDPIQPDAVIIESAALKIRQGRLVAFPTETVYGLGANALDPEAVERIFLAKKRPASDPLIAHLASSLQLSQLAVDIPELAWQLAERLKATQVTVQMIEGADHHVQAERPEPVAQAVLAFLAAKESEALHSREK